MLSLKEQVARKCIHFNGVMNKTCEAGIRYDEVRDESQKPYGFPCLKTGGYCPNAQYRTDEQVDQWIKESEEEGLKALTARAKIIQHYAATKKRSDKIPCECGGELIYAMASNGHIRCGCKSCGVSFME